MSARRSHDRQSAAHVNTSSRARRAGSPVSARGERTEIRTESSVDHTIIARIDPDGDDETPTEAVVSIGAGSVDGPLSRRAIYEELCAYVKPFESQEAYRRWADENDGVASMAIPFETAWQSREHWYR